MAAIALGPERTALFCRLWADQAVPGREIARRVRLGRDLVYQVGQALFGPRPRPSRRVMTPADDRLVVRWHKKGYTYAEMAQGLCVGRSTVRDAVARLGLPPRKAIKAEDVFRPRVLALLRSGEPARAVSRTLGVSGYRVARWRDEAGIPATSYADRSKSIQRSLRKSKAQGRPIGGLARSLAERERAMAEGWPWASRGEIALLRAMIEGGGWMSPAEANRLAGLGPQTISSTQERLRNMAGRGLVFRRGHTRRWEYRVADAVAERRREFLQDRRPEAQPRQNQPA